MRKVILDIIGIEDFNMIKIIPIPHRCNCLRCRQLEWSSIESDIKDRGYLVNINDNEGYFELNYNEGTVYLETHESGPEVISLIGNSLGLVSALLSLILTITNRFRTRSKENHYTILIRRYKKLEIEKEIEVEFDSSAPDAQRIIRELLDENLIK